MKPRVSIIVPVYNVEKYLDECLNSLVNQTFKEIEIIVVNDGSTDQSQLIVDKYTNQYPNISCIQKKNGGLSDARNTGIPYAKGEYISFIDSDDYVEPDFIELMVKEATLKKANVTVCDIDVFFENGKPGYVFEGLKNIEGKSDVQRSFLSPLFAWNKLYHRSVFEDETIRYPLNLWYEDIPVTVPLFSKQDKIGYVDKILIHYRQRETSIMGTKNSDKLVDIFTILNMVLNDFKNRNVLKQFHDEIEYLFIEHLLLYGAFRFYRSNKSEYLMGKAFEVMKDQFPQWKKNPYIKVTGKYSIYLKLLSPYTWRLFRTLILVKG